MELAERGHVGLALGAWGAVQATAQGVAIALGGALRDLVSGMAANGVFGPEWTSPSLGYRVVYSIEILLLLAALVVLIPLLLRRQRKQRAAPLAIRLGSDALGHCRKSSSRIAQDLRLPS